MRGTVLCVVRTFSSNPGHYSGDARDKQKWPHCLESPGLKSPFPQLRIPDSHEKVILNSLQSQKGLSLQFGTTKVVPFSFLLICIYSLLVFHGPGPQLPERLQMWNHWATLPTSATAHTANWSRFRNRKHSPYKTRACPFSISVNSYSSFSHLPATPAECESVCWFLRWVFFILCQLAR